MMLLRKYLSLSTTMLILSYLFLLGCASTQDMTRIESRLGELHTSIAKNQGTLRSLQNTIASLDTRVQAVETQVQEQAKLTQEMQGVIQEFRLQLAKQDELLTALKQEKNAQALTEQTTPTESSVSTTQEPLAVVSPAPVAPPPVAPLTPDELYRQAYEAFTAKDYEKAVAFFSAYVQNYPESDLADNSQYWLGETYYAMQNYAQALEAFQKVIDKYPLGNKVPDALLKRGLTFAALQEYDAALREFQKVIDRYPRSSVAQLARENITQIQQKKQ